VEGRSLRVREEDMIIEAEIRVMGPKPRNAGNL
jgi:hypothetical protein